MTQRPAGIHGLNITDFGISRDNALADIRRMSGAFVLVRNSPQLAEMCADLGARVIYRQAGDDPGASPLATDPAEFVRVRAAAAPTAAYIHLLNEVDVSVGAADDYKRWNRDALAYLDRIGRKGCFDNFSTNMHYDRWMENRDNLQAAARGGHAIGAHFYPDGQHDSGGMDFLRVREQVGGLWLLTEFAYIQSIFDANRGWLGKLSVEDYRHFMRRWSAWAAERNLPLLWFAYEHWPVSDEGRRSGFGMIDAPPLISELAALNTQHTFKEVRPMPEYPFPPLQAAWLRGTFASRNDYANIRKGPSTASEAAGRLDRTPAAGAWVATDVVEAAGTWHALKLDSGAQGYVRSDVVVFEAEAPAPEPEPEVPEPGTIYSAFLTKDEIVQLADLYEAAAAIYRAAADRITITEYEPLALRASSAKESQTVNVTPVLGPIMAILRSRKFIIAVSALLISLLVMAIPDLAEVRGELLTLLVAFGLALIGGITIEDAAKAGRDTAALPPVSIADAVLEAVKAAMEAYFERAEVEVELTPAELETIAESVRAKMAAPPAVESAG